MKQEQRLNFATFPFCNWHVYTAVFSLLGALLLIITGAHAWFLFSMREKTKATRQHIASIHQHTQETLHRMENLNTQLKVGKVETLNEKTLFVNTLIKKRLFSWNRLINALETVLPPRVYLNSIMPSFKKNKLEVRLATVSKTPEDLVDLLNRLEDSEHFTEAFPRGEREELKRTLGRGVLSEVTMVYRSDVSADHEIAPDSEENKTENNKETPQKTAKDKPSLS